MKKMSLLAIGLILWAAAASAAFIDNGDSTITDTDTGLMWEVKTDDGGLRDKDNTYTWEQALAYCENLTLAGHTDWRLPDREELRSIVDYNEYDPAIDPLFVNTISSRYWSSTTYARYTSRAWGMYFLKGSDDDYSKSYSYYVRAVREGQGSGSLGDWIITGSIATEDNTSVANVPVCMEGPVSNCDTQTAIGGRYTLGDPTRLPDGLYTVTPQSAAYIFDPPSRQVRLQGDSAFNVNFLAYPAGTPISLTIYKPSVGISVAQNELLPIEIGISGADISSPDLNTIASLIDNAGTTITKLEFSSVNPNGRRAVFMTLNTIDPGVYTLKIEAEYATDGVQNMSRTEQSRTITITSGSTGIPEKPIVEFSLDTQHKLEDGIPVVNLGQTVEYIFKFWYYQDGWAYDTDNSEQLIIYDELTGKQYNGVTDGGNLAGLWIFNVTIPQSDLTEPGLHILKWQAIPASGTGFEARYGETAFRAANNVIITATKMNDINGFVVTGEELLFRIQLQDVSGNPIQRIDDVSISTRLSYTELGQDNNFSIHDIPKQNVRFNLVDANAGIFEANFIPSTPGSLQYKLRCEFDIPDSVNPSPLEYSFIVESEDQGYQYLDMFQDELLNDFETLNQLAYDTAIAGDFFSQRKNEQAAKRGASWTKAVLSLPGVFSVDTSLSKFVENNFFNMGNLNTRMDIASNTLRKMLAEDFGADVIQSFALSGPFLYSGVIHDKVTGDLDDLVIDSIWEWIYGVNDPFTAGVLGLYSTTWPDYYNRYYRAAEADAAAAMLALPVDTSDSPGLSQKLYYYQEANAINVENVDAQLSDLLSYKKYIDETEANKIKKDILFMLDNVVPTLLTISPAGPQGAALFSVFKSSADAIIAGHEANMAGNFAEAAATGFYSSLHNSVAALSQNAVHVYDNLDVMGQMSLPDGRIDVIGQYIDENWDRFLGVYNYKQRNRYFIRVKLTNTGTVKSTFFPGMYYERELKRLFADRKQKIGQTFFHTQSGAYTNQITLLPGESQFLDFDMSRCYVEESTLPNMNIMPEAGLFYEDKPVIEFNVLATPSDTTQSRGMSFACKKEYYDYDIDNFSVIDSSKRSPSPRSGTDIFFNNPLSVRIYRTPGEDEITVSYVVTNHFVEPVNYEILQPIPAGVSAVVENGEITEVGLRFSQLVDSRDAAIFMWKTHYTGSEDLTLPEGLLRFRHPDTGDILEIPINATPKKAADIAALSFDLLTPNPWRLNQSISNRLYIFNDYDADTTISIQAALTDNTGNQASWTLPQHTAIVGESENVFSLDLAGKTLTAGEARLNITATMENGVQLQAIKDWRIMLIKDSDNDLIPDDWETENGLNPYSNDANLDKDGDGLTNLQEYENNTKANVADTDGDGLTDGQEVNQYQTDPLLADTDGGGWNDGDETSNGKDPNNNQDDTPTVVLHAPFEVTLGDLILATWTPSNPFAPNVTYRISVGTTSGADDVIAWTDTGSQRSHTLHTGLFPEGQTCYINVQLLQNGMLKASDSRSVAVGQGDHLADAIQCLQAVAGVPNTGGYYRKPDIDGDGNIGLAEAVHALRLAAGGGSGNDDTFTNSLGMTFKLIPAGVFMMGSPEDELGRYSNETQHQVTLTQDFYMMTTEVTQGQWTAVMGSNPSYFTACGDNCPVEYVSWNDIQEFITAMNQRGEGTYRLPTEAEWEYAARAGSSTAFYNGGITAETLCDIDPNLNQIGWYCWNSSGDTTHPVAQKSPNAWGLYDMSGNVLEWCQDWSDDYPSTAVTDPAGPSSGSYRVLRGGAWPYYARYCRSAYRGSRNPSDRYFYLGFRLAFSPGR